MACSGGSGDSGGDEAGNVALALGETETGMIETVGEVDTYTLQAAEANRYLTISCDERSSGSGVDLMVTVFEESEDGVLTRLFGKHKPLDATPPADIDMTIYIDAPKNLVITVRDVMDDDASSTVAYHLTCEYEGSGEGNHDFENAQPLNIDASEIFFDAIEELGEVDCFTFSPDSVGVYSVTVAFTSDYSSTNVQLASALYDANGRRIQTITEPDTVLLSLLDPADGPYYVLVHDSDDSDMDASAVYGVSVAPVTASETMANDLSGTATALTISGGVFTADGELEYASTSPSLGNGADTDWYLFNLSDPAPDTYQAVDITISGDATANPSLIFQVEVFDGDFSNLIMSRNFHCSGDDYQNRFRAESGPYYMSVTPLNPNKLDQGVTYQILLEPGDLTDDDDNTMNDAIALTSGNPAAGSVGYQSDVDWYSLTVDTSVPKIVGVELTSGSSVVDYRLSIWRGDTLIEQVSDLDGTDGDTHIKTAIYVPGDGGSVDYYFRVGDAQNDEGSDVTYTITATEAAVPTSVNDIEGETPLYYSEIDEQNGTGGTYTGVELEIFSGDQPHYLANTDWLDFKADPLPPGVATSLQGDGTTLITFPWVAGFVDYQGDRDFFQIDLDKLSDAGTETEWYYDIEIRMVVPSPGSTVEYIWKFYRDSNGNGIFMDNPTAVDGYEACDGDTTPQSQEEMDITTPTGSDIFWIGSEWGGEDNAKFYIGISDFDYQYLPGSLEENPSADDDWGFDAPYYFKLQLIYHPDVAEHPDAE
jgi:hypothetical protein